MSAGASPPIDVVPRPRHVEVLGGPGRLDPVQHVEVDHLPAQGYELVVDAEGATLSSGDEAGARHGRQVIAQLLDRAGTGAGGLPAVRVRDWPDLAHRGVMLDVSRDRVPERTTLAWLVERLERLRITHLELYVEHTFAYRGHEQVWGGASPLTPDDLGWLDDLCAARGIELVANQNTFGHMTRWLVHDRYRHRAECPDGSDGFWSPGERAEPFCLAPTSDNARFAVDLVREMSSVLRSPMVHVGGDEPFDLGQGVSREAVEHRGLPAVYLEHLRRIVDPLLADGHEVLFWGDVLRRRADLVADLPGEGTAAVVWNYEAPAGDEGSWLDLVPPEYLDRLGLPDDAAIGFEAHVRAYASNGYPFWVAPGTSSWNSLLGRWSNARANLLDAALVGVEAGARGVLVTDWGDNGHLQPLAVSMPALAYGASVAWCADTNADLDVGPVVSDLLDDPSGRLGPLLVELGDLHRSTGQTSINASPVFWALVGRPERCMGTPDRAGWSAAVELVESALDLLGRLELPGPRGDVVVAELLAVVRLARQGLWRQGAGSGLPVPTPAVLAADLEACRGLQRAAWLRSSRSGGLDDSLDRLG